MMHNNRITLIGNTPSPYTRKMLALLRYRHIPYSIIWADPKDELAARGIEPPKVSLLPTVIFTDAKGQVRAEVDSTPIIRTLEQLFKERSVLPADPALAFIDFLLEDFADEWCTKYMFHYRWYVSKDADNAGTLLPFCVDPSMSVERHQQAKRYFSKRQIERLYVVGSNDVTAPVIDASYRRFIAALDAHFLQQPYLLGARPSAGDFALFGQLTQLALFDPTPRQITLDASARTVAWTLKTEDLSGLDPSEADWLSLEESPSSLRDILCEIGRVYAPALLANAKALQAGASDWEAQIDGARWTQASFAYQGKCLQWIGAQYESLTPHDKKRVRAFLADTGCETLLP